MQCIDHFVSSSSSTVCRHLSVFNGTVQVSCRHTGVRVSVMSSYTQFCLLTETVLWLACESAVCSVAVQSLKYSAVMYRQLPLNGHLVKAEWTPKVGPCCTSVIYFISLPGRHPSKADSRSWSRACPP